MYRKHSFEAKLNLVSQVKSGLPLKLVARKYELEAKMLRHWVGLYDKYGESGLEKRLPIRATGEVKEQIVRQILENGLSLPQAALRYAVSEHALKTWIKVVKFRGYSALSEPKNPGRPLKIMGRPKKKMPQTELERLQVENARLKAEVALLKKVTALVEEREARTRMNGQKPSKN